jgi:hypothetical protein
LLQPYYKNYGKRLIKSPKLYFLDTGLASYLLGIQNEQQMQTHPLRGSLFESFIISEVLKKRFNSAITDNLYYFRDHKGFEIDLIIYKGDSVDAVEIKSGATINTDFFTNLEYFKKLGSSLDKAYLIYGGNTRRIQNSVEIFPWNQLGNI